MPEVRYKKRFDIKLRCVKMEPADSAFRPEELTLGEILANAPKRRKTKAASKAAGGGAAAGAAQGSCSAAAEGGESEKTSARGTGEGASEKTGQRGTSENASEKTNQRGTSEGQTGADVMAAKHDGSVLRDGDTSTLPRLAREGKAVRLGGRSWISWLPASRAYRGMHVPGRGWRWALVDPKEAEKVTSGSRTGREPDGETRVPGENEEGEEVAVDTGDAAGGAGNNGEEEAKESAASATPEAGATSVVRFRDVNRRRSRYGNLRRRTNEFEIGGKMATISNAFVG